MLENSWMHYRHLHNRYVHLPLQEREENRRRNTFRNCFLDRYWEALLSYWPLFFPVLSNRPRGLCESKLGPVSYFWWILHFLYSWLGSLSNDDGDVNENGKKKHYGQISKATTLHVHHAFLYISLPLLHDYDVRVSNFTFCRGREHKTTTSISFPELSYNPLEFNSRKICQHLTNWTSWNNHNKVWSSATSLFKWRFGSRRRRCWLSSLLLNSLSLHRLGCLSDYTSWTVFFRPYMT